MARPRTPIGTHGEPFYETTPGGGRIAVVRFRDFDGSTRKVKASGKSKAEALRRLKKKIADYEITREGEADLTADSAFTELVEAWLGSLDRERLAASTVYRYERDIRSYVLPAFEHYAIREITVRKVDRLLQQLRGLSYNRAQKAKVVLNLAFKLAVRWEVVERNPVAGVGPLYRPAHEVKSLSLDTIRLVRDTVVEWENERIGKPGPPPDGQIRAVIEVMLGTSARIGEVLALRRCDVDVDSEAPSVTIAGTIISVDKGQTYRQDHPKTNRSRRTIYLPVFAADALAERLAKAGAGESTDLVFSTRNGTPIAPNNYRRTLRSILKKTDAADVTPHAFRRTVATTVDRMDGIDLAAELLGHTSTEITRVHYIEPSRVVNPVTAEILELNFGANPVPIDRDHRKQRTGTSE